MTPTSYADQAHFNNYDATTYGWSSGIPPLVPFVFQGTNFGQCARDALPVFTAVLTELVPHIPGGINFGPHDDWSFSTTDDLDDGSWSMHHRGLAFDLNWNDNPMGTYSTNPDAGHLGAIPHDVAHAIAHKYGCEYGGDWSGGEGHRGFKDYMHFECHLPPSVARTVRLINPPDWMDTVDKQELSDLIDARIVANTSHVVEAIYARTIATGDVDPATGKPVLDPDTKKPVRLQLGSFLQSIRKHAMRDHEDT